MNAKRVLSCRFFWVADLAYLEGVGITPSQSVEESVVAGIQALPETVNAGLLEQLWRECDAAAYGLGRAEFNGILERVGAAQNYGQPQGATASRGQQGEFFRSLRLADLVLARACGSGSEGAWEHFMALYRQPLTRAGIAITGSETLGIELADQLYAELYGLTERDGERRCPLDSYKGRGSLIGWLRTTLAQRHVDHHRRTHREEALDDQAEGYEPAATEPAPESDSFELQTLRKALNAALRQSEAEERFLLAAYYIDERTLFEIGGMLHVHEATVSRKLRRVIDGLRKQVVKNLCGLGLSKRAAQEALGADPRDLELNLKKLLQRSEPDAFQEKAAR
jgi:RNA polymerase sigma-70 factor (ECF subfamily)